MPLTGRLVVDLFHLLDLFQGLRQLGSLVLQPLFFLLLLDFHLSDNDKEISRKDSMSAREIHKRCRYWHRNFKEGSNKGAEKSSS